MEEQFAKWLPIFILIIANVLSISSVYWNTQVRIAVLKEKIQALEKQQVDYSTLHDNVVEIKTKLNYFLPKNINENAKSI